MQKKQEIWMDKINKSDNVSKGQFAFFKQIRQINLTLSPPDFDSKLEKLLP